MKYIEYIIAGFIAVFPMLWIDDYTYKNPVWWTVILAWMIGKFFGEYISNKK